jgi:hypothetical protein
MISRKEVQTHISNKPYLRQLDLDVFKTQDGLRIVGRGIDKTFATNRGAKTFVTRLNNAELCRRVDARLFH